MKNDLPQQTINSENYSTRCSISQYPPLNNWPKFWNLNLNSSLQIDATYRAKCFPVCYKWWSLEPCNNSNSRIFGKGIRRVMHNRTYKFGGKLQQFCWLVLLLFPKTWKVQLYRSRRNIWRLINPTCSSFESNLCFLKNISQPKMKCLQQKW